MTSNQIILEIKSIMVLVIYEELNLTTVIQYNLCYLTTVKLINTIFWYPMTFLKK